MQTYRVYSWGRNTLKACRDILLASQDGADILLHTGEFNSEDSRHVETISNACRVSDVELVVSGIEDPGFVYPHITFVEDDDDND